MAAATTLAIFVMAFWRLDLAPHTPFDPATSTSLNDGLKPPVLLSPDGDWRFRSAPDEQGRDLLSVRSCTGAVVAGRRPRPVVRHGGRRHARPGQRLFWRHRSTPSSCASPTSSFTLPAILVALLIDGVVRTASRCSAATRLPGRSSSARSGCRSG